MERCCGTCKWHWYENVDEDFVCTNIDSEYCADWTDYADSCSDCKRIKNQVNASRITEVSIKCTKFQKNQVNMRGADNG